MKSADGRFEYRDAEGKPVPEGTPLEAVQRFAYKCRRDALYREEFRCAVAVSTEPKEPNNRIWQISGSVDAPTLTPSIDCKGCWHGFIKSGVFLKVGDAPEEIQ